MEGVLSEQAPAGLHDEIDFDNTEFDANKTQGEDFEFDTAGYIVQDDEPEPVSGHGTDSTNDGVARDATDYDDYDGMARHTMPDNDAETTHDAGEGEIDYVHDGIGESLDVSGIGGDIGDSLRQAAGDMNTENGYYDEISYQDGDEEITTQHEELETGNADGKHPVSENFGDQLLVQEPTDEILLDNPQVHEPSGGLTEGATTSVLSQDYAENQEAPNPEDDASRVSQSDALEGDGQADTDALAVESADARPEGFDPNDGLDDQYDESAYSVDDASGYDGHDFTMPHPDVTFCYRHDEYSLFAESADDDPNTYFLADTEAMNLPLCDFLTKIRGIIAGEISAGDEIVLRVDGLGLEFGETTTKEFLDQTTFGQIIELHERLVKLDDAAATRNLYVYLITRSNCLHRFSELTNGVTDGKGLSVFERYFDAPSPVDDNQGDESHDLSHVDEILGDAMNDSHFDGIDTVDEDAHEDHHFDDAAIVDVEQIDQDSDTGPAHDTVEKVVEITHTGSLEVYEDSHHGEPDASYDHAAIDGQPDQGEGSLLQASDEQSHGQLAEPTLESESEFYKQSLTVLEDDQPQESEAVATFQEEELFDYDDGEEFDEQADVQTMNADDHVVHDPQLEAIADTADEGNENSHVQHEINYTTQADDRLDLDNAPEVNTAPSTFQETATQDISLDQSGTPKPVSDNTSASNTLNGDEINFDDDDMGQSPVNNSSGDAPTTQPEAEADEIDWDHDEDDIVDANNTNLDLSSNSTKRARQPDTEASLDDENAVKRRRT